MLRRPPPQAPAVLQDTCLNIDAFSRQNEQLFAQNYRFVGENHEIGHWFKWCKYLASVAGEALKQREQANRRLERQKLLLEQEKVRVEEGKELIWRLEEKQIPFLENKARLLEDKVRKLREAPPPPPPPPPRPPRQRLSISAPSPSSSVSIPPSNSNPVLLPENTPPRPPRQKLTISSPTSTSSISIPPSPGSPLVLPKSTPDKLTAAASSPTPSTASEPPSSLPSKPDLSFTTTKTNNIHQRLARLEEHHHRLHQALFNRQPTPLPTPSHQSWMLYGEAQQQQHPVTYQQAPAHFNNAPFSTTATTTTPLNNNNLPVPKRHFTQAPGSAAICKHCGEAYPPNIYNPHIDQAWLYNHYLGTGHSFQVAEGFNPRKRAFDDMLNY
ncbi:hypothetical protein QBC41DRAFT_307220 [Cercophora samala]|uniref:Uncharacterized protein n=1 Tax=Cercophora samala TaxID=330535 RepID=A0AA40D3U0_9PEZI|nr:hypothetical protein QBC41DRAFT_307220 [Cercophora samala]